MEGRHLGSGAMKYGTCPNKLNQILEFGLFVFSSMDVLVSSQRNSWKVAGSNCRISFQNVLSFEQFCYQMQTVL